MGLQHTDLIFGEAEGEPGSTFRARLQAAARRIGSPDCRRDFRTSPLQGYPRAAVPAVFCRKSTAIGVSSRPAQHAPKRTAMIPQNRIRIWQFYRRCDRGPGAISRSSHADRIEDGRGEMERVLARKGLTAPALCRADRRQYARTPGK